jgi:uncharacterized membrane protein YeaQ/YmgE (transglycosylase-associated protein family)
MTKVHALAVTVGMISGSVVGGYVPTLLGADSFSFTSLFASGAGAVLGIWLAFKLTRSG